MKKKIRAVIYIRYSSHRQAESFSIEYQLAECEKFIKQNGYILIDEYVDKAKSGKKVAGRDQFDKMIFDASLDKFDKVIVFSFSRSFRNTRDALNYNHDLMEKYGIMIESVIERIDLNDPHGRFSSTNLFAMHELQADIIAAHVKSGMYFAAQQGYYLGGHVPYGYELYGTGEFSRGKERRKYRPNKLEVPIVKEVFSLYADGFSLSYIQDDLRKKGIKGRSGKIIGISTLKGMLQNLFYIGKRLYEVKGYDPLIIENVTEPIIDLDIWHKVQARFNSNKRVKPRKRDVRYYALTGKIECAECGGHFHGTYRSTKSKTGKEYAYYICCNRRLRRTCNTKSIRKDQLEAYCMQQIKEHILNEKAMRSISEQIATVVGDSSAEMLAKYEKSQKRREKVADILTQIRKDVYEKEISKEMGDKMSAEYEKELLELENSIASLKSALKSAITPEGVYSYLKELFSLSSANNDEILKMLFDKLIENITIEDDLVKVHLVVSPFAKIGDNSYLGQPHYSLSKQTNRKALKLL